MMRLGRKPQSDCGQAHALNHAEGGRWSQRMAFCAVLTFACTTLIDTFTPTPAHAQNTTVVKKTTNTAPTFDTKRGGLLPSTKIDRSQPLYLQGDQLIYDADGLRARR